MDRGYIDFVRLYALHQDKAFFIVRAKSNIQCRKFYSHPVDKTTGLRCDQTVILTTYQSAKGYPEKLRLIKFFDSEHNQRLIYLANHFTLDAINIAQLYKYRWKIELFFK